MVKSLPRDIALAVVCIACVALMMLGPAADSSEAATCGGSETPAYELASRDARSATLCLLNRARAARGLKPLHFDSKQQKAADDHNRMMIRKGCFSHQCSGEQDLVGRMENSGYLPCSCSWSVGENIAWGTRSTASPRKIVDAWMASPPHRVNILNKSFDEVGLGIASGSPAGGGKTATYTADFGYKN